MNTVSNTPATSGKARLRGVALASVIIALMPSLLLEALDQTMKVKNALCSPPNTGFCSCVARSHFSPVKNEARWKQEPSSVQYRECLRRYRSPVA
jgi:hypothetical protein